MTVRYRVSVDTGHQWEVEADYYRAGLAAADKCEDAIGSRASRRFDSLWYFDEGLGQWISGDDLLAGGPPLTVDSVESDMCALGYPVAARHGSGWRVAVAGEAIAVRHVLSLPGVVIDRLAVRLRRLGWTVQVMPWEGRPWLKITA